MFSPRFIIPLHCLMLTLSHLYLSRTCRLMFTRDTQCCCRHHQGEVLHRHTKAQSSRRTVLDKGQEQGRGQGRGLLGESHRGPDACSRTRPPRQTSKGRWLQKGQLGMH